MCFPDLVIEVSDTETIAVLLTQNRSQRKSFPAGWSGTYTLVVWMRDLGIRECNIRIKIAEGTFIGTAATIVAQLGIAGHSVRLAA